MKGLFKELKRRNVFKVAVAYAVVAWVLAQAADLLLRTFGAPEGFLKGFYIILALGFPLALFLAWAFEMTPEGVKTTRAAARSPSAGPRKGQAINKVIAVGLILALGFIAYDKLFSPDSVKDARAAQASIAVLPFVNMSNDPNQEYFSDGISEELLNVLAKIPEMEVAGRTSSFAFKGKNPSFAEIGQALGVANVLEGSVRKQGERVRITAQLIRTSDGFHVWSETYDRTLDDIFAVQDEIASAIVKELKVRILGAGLPSAQNRNVSAAAHNDYLLGLQRLNQGEAKPMLEARDYFRRAYKDSPGYLDALWGYGLAVSDLERYGTIERNEAIPQLDETLSTLGRYETEPAPLTLLLQAKMEHLQDRHDAEEALVIKAFEADPAEPRILLARADAYTRNDQYDQALELLNRALARDPLSLRLLGTLGRTYAAADRDDQLEQTLNRMIEIDPGYAEAYYGLAFLKGNKGQMAEATINLILAAENDKDDPDGPITAALLFMQFGFLDEAQSYLEQADARSPNQVYTIAARSNLLALRGELEAAGTMAEGLLVSGRPQRSNSDGLARNVAAFAFIKTGQPARLRDMVLAYIPELAADPLDYTTDVDGKHSPAFRARFAEMLALAERALGEGDRANAILHAALAAIRKEAKDERAWDTLPFLVLLGRTEEAMALIKDPKNAKELLPTLLIPTSRWRLEPLAGNPEFDAITAKVDAKIAAERVKLAAWLAAEKAKNSSNP